MRDASACDCHEHTVALSFAVLRKPQNHVCTLDSPPCSRRRARYLQLCLDPVISTKPKIIARDHFLEASEIITMRIGRVLEHDVRQSLRLVRASIIRAWLNGTGLGTAGAKRHANPTADRCALLCVHCNSQRLRPLSCIAGTVAAKVPDAPRASELTCFVGTRLGRERSDEDVLACFALHSSTSVGSTSAIGSNTVAELPHLTEVTHINAVLFVHRNSILRGVLALRAG